MSQAEIVQERLDKSRERFLEVIEFLPDAALLEARAVEEYSIADLMALQTAWEAELVTGLMRLDQNTEPAKLLAALRNPEAYAADSVAESRTRDLDAIFDDFQQVRAQLEAWLEYFSNRDMTDPNRYKWLTGKSLAQLIAEVTYEREMAYVSNLGSFAQHWNQRNGT
jgi:hypothetical protein